MPKQVRLKDIVIELDTGVISEVVCVVERQGKVEMVSCLDLQGGGISDVDPERVWVTGVEFVD